MKYFVIYLILLTVVPAFALQASALQAETAGFAVSGKVLQYPEGQPVRKANVQLTQLNGQSGNHAGRYSAVTDANGQFAIADVKPGRYLVEIEHAGLVQNGGGRVGVSVAQNRTDLVFRMQPAAVITGKITDADGEPMRNVAVNATKVSSHQAANRYASFSGSTNDLGEFRIPDLRTGKYIVVAIPHQGVQAPTAEEKGKDREHFTYVATYYPGTLNKDQSLPVDVQPGSETPVNITVLSSKAYHVTGEVTGLPSKALISEIFLTSPRGFDAQQRLEQGGHFEFANVLPGTYHARVMVVTGFKEGSQPNMQMMQLEPAIDVTDADANGLHLHAAEAAQLHGHLQMDTGQKFDWTQLTVFLQPVVNEGDTDIQMMGNFGGPNFTTAKADGTFELKNVAAGNYHLMVGAAGSSDKLRDYYTESVMLDGQEVGDSGFRVAAGVSLQVVISAKGAAIEGTVIDGNGKAIPYASVVDVPSPERRSRRDLYQQDTTDEHGHFSFRGLNPGTYNVLALEDLPENVQDPEFLNLYGSRGEKVQLEEGSHQNVVLKVIPASTP